MKLEKGYRRLANECDIINTYKMKC